MPKYPIPAPEAHSLTVSPAYTRALRAKIVDAVDEPEASGLLSVVDKMANPTGRAEDLSADVGEMWRLLAVSTYESEDYVGLAMREMLQNSVDAVKAALARGAKSHGIAEGEGRIDVKWLPGADAEAGVGTLVLEDNGIGMDAKTLRTKMLTLASTGKAGEDSMGGFGVAKAVILGSSTTWSWEIRTRDLRVSSLLRNGFKQYVLEGGLPYRQGTKFTIRDIQYSSAYRPLSGEWGDLPSDVLRKIFQWSPNPWIQYTLNGQRVTGMSKVPPRRKIGQLGGDASEDEGSTRISVYRDVSTSTRLRNVPVIVRLVKRSRFGTFALFQAVHQVYSPNSPPFGLIVDIRTTLEPKHGSYPLTASRDAINPSARAARRVFEGIKRYLGSYESTAVRADEYAVLSPGARTDKARQGTAAFSKALAKASEDPKLAKILAARGDEEAARRRAEAESAIAEALERLATRAEDVAGAEEARRDAEEQERAIAKAEHRLPSASAPAVEQAAATSAAARAMLALEERQAEWAREVRALTNGELDWRTTLKLHPVPTSVVPDSAIQERFQRLLPAATTLIEAATRVFRAAVMVAVDTAALSKEQDTGYALHALTPGEIRSLLFALALLSEKPTYTAVAHATLGGGHAEPELQDLVLQVQYAGAPSGLPENATLAFAGAMDMAKTAEVTRRPFGYTAPDTWRKVLGPAYSVGLTRALGIAALVPYLAAIPDLRDTWATEHRATFLAELDLLHKDASDNPLGDSAALVFANSESRYGKQRRTAFLRGVARHVPTLIVWRCFLDELQRTLGLPEVTAGFVLDDEVVGLAQTNTTVYPATRTVSINPEYVARTVKDYPKNAEAIAIRIYGTATHEYAHILTPGDAHREAFMVKWSGLLQLGAPLFPVLVQSVVSVLGVRPMHAVTLGADAPAPPDSKKLMKAAKRARDKALAEHEKALVALRKEHSAEIARLTESEQLARAAIEQNEDQAEGLINELRKVRDLGLFLNYLEDNPEILIPLDPSERYSDEPLHAVEARDLRKWALQNARAVRGALYTFPEFSY